MSNNEFDLNTNVSFDFEVKSLLDEQPAPEVKTEVSTSVNKRVNLPTDGVAFVEALEKKDEEIKRLCKYIKVLEDRLNNLMRQATKLQSKGESFDHLFYQPEQVVKQSKHHMTINEFRNMFNGRTKKARK